MGQRFKMIILLFILIFSSIEKSFSNCSTELSNLYNNNQLTELFEKGYYFGFEQDLPDHFTKFHIQQKDLDKLNELYRKKIKIIQNKNYVHNPYYVSDIIKKIADIYINAGLRNLPERIKNLVLHRVEYSNKEMGRIIHSRVDDVRLKAEITISLPYKVNLQSILAQSVLLHEVSHLIDEFMNQVPSTSEEPSILRKVLHLGPPIKKLKKEFYSSETSAMLAEWTFFQLIPQELIDGELKRLRNLLEGDKDLPFIEILFQAKKLSFQDYIKLQHSLDRYTKSKIDKLTKKELKRQQEVKKKIKQNKKDEKKRKKKRAGNIKRKPNFYK